VSTVVIVGANVAGGRAAETLRQQGFDGRVVLLGAEPERPYERPPLSKEYLLGKVAEEKLYLRPPAYYDEQGIDLWLGARATRLAPHGGPRSRHVELADGRYVGHTTGQDDVVLRGSVEAASWSAFYVRDGYLVAALAANRFKDVAAARQLIARRVPVEARRLADESTDLRALAKARAPHAGSLSS
jgi:hypothetical protein